MLVASKYEEMFAPEVGDFEYITDNAYTSADIRKQECEMLRHLDFNLGKPLPLHFLRRNSKAGQVGCIQKSKFCVSAPSLVNPFCASGPHASFLKYGFSRF